MLDIESIIMLSNAEIVYGKIDAFYSARREIIAF